MLPAKSALTAAFTLIEVSIVLVIIGLIIGGVLVGESLIGAATAQAQMSQIQRYDTAVNTFMAKCGYLPGDAPSAAASACGLQPRGQYAGEGDGNGLLDGVWSNEAGDSGRQYQAAGETAVFWVDLSTAGLIDGGFSTASENSGQIINITLTSTPNIGAYIPQAKIGGGNYIIAGERPTYIGGGKFGTAGTNWYSLEVVEDLGGGGEFLATTGLTVAQAYSIDKKIDDGLPQSGNVIAEYVTNDSMLSFVWAGGTDNWDHPYTTATSGSATTCFDNGGVTGAAQQYSMEQKGSGLNCALSFEMQGAAR
jgi:prepilin-type N-terminal cleavage/methylation domain-containing protein